MYAPQQRGAACELPACVQEPCTYALPGAPDLAAASTGHPGRRPAGWLCAYCSVWRTTARMAAVDTDGGRARCAVEEEAKKAKASFSFNVLCAGVFLDVFCACTTDPLCPALLAQMGMGSARISNALAGAWWPPPHRVLVWLWQIACRCPFNPWTPGASHKAPPPRRAGIRADTLSALSE